ncbi:MAG: glutathione S-transferase family protein [Hoeflea sp.]|uniref:glutathione S-transferase family protein n=1 Tax=Hoeflea sp. TaxID=1940281 RepID=UPI00329A39BD|tara:strand:+ start:7701 stop:8324 length:624 start_codon:yes stop_codon:yes gene_type:complete
MSDYRLYWRPGAGSMVVEAALRLIGAAFECVRIDEDSALHTPKFLALNPAGKIPVLELPSGQVIAESVAILLALDETFPEARLLPPHGSPARNVAVQWLIFMTANIYPDALRLYYAPRHTDDASPEAADAIKRQAIKDLDRDFAQLASAISGPFLLGSTMTITDVYAAMLADWHRPAMDLPEISDLVAQVLKNPAVAKAWHNHEYGC